MYLCAYKHTHTHTHTCREREFRIKGLAELFLDTPLFNAHTTAGDEHVCYCSRACICVCMCVCVCSHLYRYECAHMHVATAGSSMYAAPCADVSVHVGGR
jgi:hypothetical protein